MSKLTESEYEEYMQLLKAWVQADKVLEGPADGEAAAHARPTHAAVQDFRQRYGLGEAAVREPQPMAEGKGR